MYSLLDFGQGRKLERFGQWVLNRPAPAAEGKIFKLPSSAWQRADARYELAHDEKPGGLRGTWHDRSKLPDAWPLDCGTFCLELRRTEFGHLGVFPEQAGNWPWIAEQIRVADQPLKVLNLFAYTGGSTLAAAAAGAEVTHVDAAQNVVTWARRNAELSGLQAAPVRWIAEDAVKFARRELKRGRQYDAVILDPPSYGHGPAGEVWKLADDLSKLLELCRELTAGRPRFMLLSCHTPQFDGPALRKMFGEATGLQSNGRDGCCQSLNMDLQTPDGRKLPCGVALRFQAEQ